MDLNDIHLSTASERVGDRFWIDVDDGSTIELELIEAKQASVSPSGGRSDSSFSLTFRGPAEPLLAQGILPLQHDAWGVTHIFVVPIRQDGEGSHYEAAFNRDV